MNQVKCDSCGWTKPVKDAAGVAEWHNRRCPLCGASPVVSDDDMAVLASLTALVDAGVMRWADGAEPAGGVLIHVDTGPLRGEP